MHTESLASAPDTKATTRSVLLGDSELARATRLRLWAEHLEVDISEIANDRPSTVVDERWRPIATEQLSRLERSAAPTHRLLALPGESRRSRRMLGPLVGLIDDG